MLHLTLQSPVAAMLIWVVCLLQSYGNEPLSAMVGWLRDAARHLGHQSSLEPPLLSTMETHTYQEVLAFSRLLTLL